MFSFILLQHLFYFIAHETSPLYSYIDWHVVVKRQLHTWTQSTIGEGWGNIDPQRTRSYFWGFTPLCQIWWKSTQKCDRESDDTRTDRHTHTHTHTHTDWQTQTDFIICPMLYAIAMGQIIKARKIHTVGLWWYIYRHTSHSYVSGARYSKNFKTTLWQS